MGRASVWGTVLTIAVYLLGSIAVMPPICIKAFRETDLEAIYLQLLNACTFLLSGCITLTPGVRQTVNTWLLSIGER